MPSEAEIRDYVSSLDEREFRCLENEAKRRECREKLGFADMEALAERLGRKPICPMCGCIDHTLEGREADGSKRYRCKGCGSRYSLLSGSVLSGAKTELWQWHLMIKLMSFNVPLDLIAEVAGVHHNTALLMRRKLFETVSLWQSKVILRDVVWIDEIYDFDSARPKNHFGPNRRGLSKDKCCVFVAIDHYKNMVAFFVGHGLPTSSEIKGAIIPHLEKGAGVTIIHDGLHSHADAIDEAKAKDEIHKSTCRDAGSLRAMLLADSFCSWIQRYLSRFTGMDTEYLQDYLNWFVYLFRCKESDEKWPEDERVMRHVILDRTTLTRSMVRKKRAESRARIEGRRASSGGKKSTEQAKRRNQK